MITFVLAALQSHVSSFQNRGVKVAMSTEITAADHQMRGTVWKPKRGDSTSMLVRTADMVEEAGFTLVGNGYCRTADGGKGTFTTPTASSSSDCKTKCEESSTCVAVE